MSYGVFSFKHPIDIPLFVLTAANFLCKSISETCVKSR
jgi:hypothetical protein